MAEAYDAVVAGQYDDFGEQSVAVSADVEAAAAGHHLCAVDAVGLPAIEEFHAV